MSRGPLRRHCLRMRPSYPNGSAWMKAGVAPAELQHAFFPIVGMTAGVSYCDYQDDLIDKHIRDVVRKSWEVHAAKTFLPDTPKQRVFQNSSTSTLDLAAKPNAQPGGSCFIITRDAFQLCQRLRDKFESEAHEPGAIFRSRAKTSAAGMEGLSPDRYRSRRRATSASHAASAPGSGSGSTLSSNCLASETRWSGGRPRPSLNKDSSVAVISATKSYISAVRKPRQRPVNFGFSPSSLQSHALVLEFPDFDGKPSVPGATSCRRLLSGWKHFMLGDERPDYESLTH